MTRTRPPHGRQVVSASSGLRTARPSGRMTLQLVEAHEGTNPMDVGLLRPYAVVKITNALTNLIEQA